MSLKDVITANNGGQVNSEFMNGTVLLGTKLYKPAPLPRVIDRSKILDNVSGSAPVKVILITAPAGFGKTTLVAEWVAGLQRGTERYHAAWLALDKTDNDVGRFWKYVITALQTVDPRIGQNLSALPPGPVRLPFESWLPELLHDLETTPGAIDLVLDDYHFISTPAIHQSLNYFIQHLPPSVRLILITRANPPLSLARLRVQGELFEVRAADLLFEPSEVEQYLNDVWQLGLTGELVAQLFQHTEGWPAGVMLAARLLQGCDAAARHEFVRSFSGSNRLILNYLLEEVLLQQQPATRDFLLQTSLLPKLSAPLCAFVTGQSVEEAGRILSGLAGEHLFIVSIDDQGIWYRYHLLFAEALNSMLCVERPALWIYTHKRIVDWCVDNGQPEWAVAHALAGHDYERAAGLIESIGDSVWSAGDLTSPLLWIQSLPASLVDSRVALSLLHIWLLFINDRWREATTLWHQIGYRLTDRDDGDNRHLLGRWAAIGGAMAGYRNEPEEAIRLTGPALAQLSPTDHLWRALSQFTLGLAYQTQGQAKQAADTYHRTIDLCSANDIPYLAFLATVHLIEVCRSQGLLYEAQALCEQLHDSGMALPSSRTNGSICLGILLYERNDLAMAESMLVNGLKYNWPGTPPRIVLTGQVTLAKVYQARGEWAAANATLDAALEMAMRLRLPAEERLVRAHQAHLAMKEERWDEVKCWQALAQLSTEDLPDLRREFEHLVLAEMLIAEERYQPAEGLLARLRAAAERSGRGDSEIVLSLLYAVSLDRQNRHAEAEAAVRHILPLAHAQDYARAFLDIGSGLEELLVRPGIRHHAPAYIDRLCHAFESGKKLRTAEGKNGHMPALHLAGDPPAAIDQLTPREWEILSMIARGYSNQEIADKLVLSVGTVKGHVNHIFSKLDVHNRTAAVARARDNQLILV